MIGKFDGRVYGQSLLQRKRSGDLIIDILLHVTKKIDDAYVWSVSLKGIPNPAH